MCGACCSAGAVMPDKSPLASTSMRDRLHFLSVLIVFALMCVACNRQSTEFKEIQQQHSGDYTVVLLNETGTLKQHSDHLRIEFRNASTNELANVSNVQIQSSMRMPGMGPMFGNVSSMRQVSTGRYDFDTDFSMAGQWNLLVTFDPNGRAQFNV